MELAQKYVLIIDDYELTCKIISMILSKMGFYVEAAYTGSDGLKAASQNNYSLILLDLNLPDIDGLEIAQKIKSYTKALDAKIVAFTGRDVDQSHYKRYGIDGVLTKPFTNRQIVELVNDIPQSLN
jgi:DNA-binding response OmpR family regulator